MSNETKLDLEFTYSSNLIDWMKTNKCSFAFTSYKTNKLYSFGVTIDPRDGIEKLSIWFTCFNRPTSLYVDMTDMSDMSDVTDKAWLVTKNSIWKYVNGTSDNTIISNDDNINNDFDISFTPIKIYNTNTIDAHDITKDHNDKILFCNTKFSCISELDDNYNFKVYYKPPWISKLLPEDRCHLNGLCLDENNVVRYITAVCDSDVHDGWRNRRNDGFIYDIIDDKKICENLIMPHSPRFYQNKLWVLNSGRGEFGYIKNGKFVPITFIPGFLRGMDFVNKYAIIGSSMDRHERRFSGLELENILIEKKVEARCGIYIVDINNGAIIANISFDNLIELYDVKLIKNKKRPRFLDIMDDINENNYRFY